MAKAKAAATEAVVVREAVLTDAEWGAAVELAGRLAYSRGAERGELVATAAAVLLADQRATDAARAEAAAKDAAQSEAASKGPSA